MEPTDAIGNFVLVHGAFHGGWCWRRVADRLTQAGGRVFAPTCTGLGERVHLLTPETSHRTFVEDVAGLIEAEELDDIVLVGHSFGGVVISGVADRMPDRIRNLVYFDSLILSDGESAMDRLPPEIGSDRIRSAISVGGVPCMRVPPPAAFGLKPGPDSDWVARRLTPHPLAAYTEPMRLRHPVGNGVPRSYILCTAPAHPAVASSYEWVRSQAGWRIVEIAHCHDAMVTAPDELSELLLHLGK